VKNSLDEISLAGGQVNCIIGILPEERRNPQPLSYEITLYLDTRWAARTGAVEDTCDYGQIKNWVESFLVDGAFELLETAAHNMAIQLLARPINDKKRIKQVRITLKKPQVFEDSCVPSLTIFRQVDEAAQVSP
jgi:dihydroneopterin aldolase